jgi:hypothetical protein
MPITIVPKDVNEPPSPQETNRPEAGLETIEPEPPVLRGSRWVDYDTHELLEQISELEDERRWARLREGVLWALLFHILLISALTWIPKYVFKLPQVLDPIDAIQKRKDLTYLDLPPDALRNLQPRVVIKPVPPRQTAVDKSTLEALKRATPPKAAPPTPTPPPPTPAPTVAPPTAPSPTPIPPSPPIQAQTQTPRPSAVPARPNFAMNSENPVDQLHEAMRNSARNGGPATDTGNLAGGGLARHPGAGSGGVEVLSDTQGVDFRSWLQRWHHETENTWDPLIPDEVNPPILKSGTVVIRFKVLPNGRLMDGSLTLEGRSGDTALDRAAWGALTGSNYPPLPRDFHGPYIELRAYFLYNMQMPK